MALQTPQAADITWNKAGSSPAGFQAIRANNRQAWNAKPTAAIYKAQ